MGKALKAIRKELAEIFKVKGKTKKETLENLSFLTILLSAFLIAVGIGLGSFFRYVILLASLGAFLVLVGIVIFIVAELMEE